MTDKQQTAFQWLKGQLAVTYSPADIEWLWFKALEMEREQRIEDMRTAFYKGAEAWMQNPDAQESIFNNFIKDY